MINPGICSGRFCFLPLYCPPGLTHRVLREAPAGGDTASRQFMEALRAG